MTFAGLDAWVLLSTGAHSLSGGVRTAGVAFLAGREVLDVIFSDGSLVQVDATGVHVLGSVL